jgi:hypothetical protein
MILNQVKELNITDEELSNDKKPFDSIYEEYIKINQDNKSNYIYKNPIDKMRKFHNEKIIKTIGKREDNYIYDRYAVNKKK